MNSNSDNGKLKPFDIQGTYVHIPQALQMVHFDEYTVNDFWYLQ